MTRTIVRLDRRASSVAIQTDLKKTPVFEVPQAVLLKELSQGNRVIVELGEQGKVQTITRMTIPELTPPAWV